MFRVLFSLLIVLKLPFLAQGQGREIVGDMRSTLQSKDFTALQKKIESRPGANWESLRDITRDFKEGVLFFGYIVKDKDNPAMGTHYTFRVNLIIRKAKIIYFELSEKNFRKSGEEWMPYYSIIDRFKNDSSYNSLKTSFKLLFHTNLNEHELFLTDFVYGNKCGIGGDDPEGRKHIDELVLKKDKTSILKWLTSTNTERQIYAVDGLFQLKHLGIKLSKNELRIIDFIARKSGTVYVCSGCIFGRREISQVTSHYKF